MLDALESESADEEDVVTAGSESGSEVVGIVSAVGGVDVANVSGVVEALSVFPVLSTRTVRSTSETTPAASITR